MEARAPAQTVGLVDVVNINPLATHLIASMILELPTIYPPWTPKAFPSVPFMIFILSDKPSFSQ